MKQMPRKRLSGPERLARDFTALVAEESLASGYRGSRRLIPWGRLVKWSEKALRSSRGDANLLSEWVSRKLLSIVHRGLPEKTDRCRKKALAFARRHRLILAEQVLSSGVEEGHEPPERKTILFLPGFGASK